MHFLRNPQKVHPTLNTRAEPGTGHGAAVLQWAQKRDWLFSFLHPFFLSWKWRNGGRTRNPHFPSSEDVGWDTLGRTGPAWVTDAHGSQRQRLLPSTEEEEGFSALELQTAWPFLCAATKDSVLYFLLYGQ